MKKLLLGVVLLTSMTLNAQDRLFTYTYQSNVLNKGQREIEVWNTWRVGKASYFSRLDNRTEYEIGLGSNLQTSFYLNLTTATEAVNNNNSLSLETENEISISNEWKWKLLDPVADPIGLALYGEYGIGSTEYEAEGKIIIDKKINNFTLAANGIYEAEFKPMLVSNQVEWEQEIKMDANLAVAYSLSPKFHLTFENAYRNVFGEGKLLHSALYSGLGISCNQDNFWINLTVLPQIKSFKGETNNSLLNLTEFEKIQFRLLFSYAF